MSLSRRSALLSVPALAGTLAALPSRPAGAQLLQLLEPNQAKLLAKLLPTVVNIHSVVSGALPPAAGEAGSSIAATTPARPNTLDGSGFVIDASGIIITNNHVVAGAFEITVMFSDGERMPARLIGSASAVDIAILKVDTTKKLTVVRWGNSDKLRIGDTVYAIGNPLGVGLSVSSGIVSALNRNIMDTPYDDFIQTDAPINHGNSGGPLFNRNGRVVGMDTAIISPTTGSVGLGFAIPSNDVHFVANRLIQYGWIRPGWLGVKVEDVTPDMAQALDMPDVTGSIVALVRPGSPAEAGGLQVGDVIVKYNGKEPPDERALLRMIAETPAGQTMPLDVLRNGKPIALQVTIQDWPKAEWDARFPTTPQPPIPHGVPPNLGLSLSQMTDDLRARYGLHMHQPGVLIAGVAAGTDAAARGLAAGDVLLRLQGTDVHSPDQVQSILDAARAEHKSFILALVLPKTAENPGPQWVPLKLGSS